MFHVFAALANFIRELIVDGTHERPSRRPGRYLPELTDSARVLQGRTSPPGVGDVLRVGP
ncbi:hypothetical protein [Nocardia rhamnosiphila]|uniref:Resolvase/invertase-type recombinase catalytic domain-containing protein n=1 Tax=Nocardia rhamnosiphila TaxID=426716 RepID=A0ABV2WUM1_9NOCA|nr:hypothetical protein [Nocardia rhamnosiphila]